MTTKTIAVDRIYLSKTKGAIKGFASLRVADAFIIRNLKIIEGKNGLFVAMPAEKYQEKGNAEKKFTDIAFPLNKAIYQEVQTSVLAAYTQKIQGLESGSN
jgi:stage V sporulation protein G